MDSKDNKMKKLEKISAIGLLAGAVTVISGIILKNNPIIYIGGGALTLGGIGISMYQEDTKRKDNKLNLYN